MPKLGMPQNLYADLAFAWALETHYASWRQPKPEINAPVLRDHERELAVIAALFKRK